MSIIGVICLLISMIQKSRIICKYVGEPYTIQNNQYFPYHELNYTIQNKLGTNKQKTIRKLQFHAPTHLKASAERVTTLIQE